MIKQMCFEFCGDLALKRVGGIYRQTRSTPQDTKDFSDATRSSLRASLYASCSGIFVYLLGSQ